MVFRNLCEWVFATCGTILPSIGEVLRRRQMPCTSPYVPWILLTASVLLSSIRSLSSAMEIPNSLSLPSATEFPGGWSTVLLAMLLLFYLAVSDGLGEEPNLVALRLFCSMSLGPMYFLWCGVGEDCSHRMQSEYFQVSSWPGRACSFRVTMQTRK